MSTAAAIALGLLTAAMWAILCRVNQMQRSVTRGIVFWQHAALGLGLICGLVLPAEWARVALAAGVLLFLLGSSARWKDGAPAGTEKEPTR